MASQNTPRATPAPAEAARAPGKAAPPAGKPAPPPQALSPSDPGIDDSFTRLRPPKWFGKRVGRFKLINLLGKGAFGRVFLAEDVDLQRQVALKVLTPDAGARSAREEAVAAGESVETTGLDAAMHQTVERMIYEARAAAKLDHPNIVQILEVGRLEGTGLCGYIAMELLEGGTLQELVRAAGPMDVPRACTVIAEAAEALAYAHEMGVIHRDIKPANLMLGRGGRCKVVDFGLACVEESARQKRPFPVGGTASYLAPELIRGGPPDPKTDQYALAATLYALLVGHGPFKRETKRQILEAHLRSPVPDIRKLRPDIEEGLWNIIRRGMSKDPAQRFANARQLGHALRVYTISPHQQSEASEIFAASLAGALAPAAGPDAAAQRRAAARGPSGANLDALTVFMKRNWRYLAVGAAPPLLLLALLLGLRGCAGGSPESVAASVPAPPVALHPDREAAPGTAAAEPAPQDADYIPAADYDRLVRIARGEDPVHSDRMARVGGRVVHARASETGRVFRIFFEGAQREQSFGVVYFPALFPAMQEKFGGESGSGLEGKLIRVTGEVDLYQDNPQIVVESPEQIEVVE